MSKDPRPEPMRKADVNIIVAAREGKLDKVIRLVRENGVSTDFQEIEGSPTPLMMAATGGFVDILEFLLNPGPGIAKADINKQDREQRTALINAVLNNKVECVKLLMNNGADPHLHSRNGWTPLYIAANKGYTEIARVLLNQDGHSASHNNGPRQTANVDMVIQNTVGGTVLMVACMQGHFEIVKCLLENGADVNAKDNQNWTALMKAADKGHVELVKLLLACNVDVLVEDKAGFTAIHLAAKAGKEATVAALLSHPDIEANAVDQNNRTPLYYAAEKKHLEVVRTLLSDTRVDVTIAEKVKGVTALTVPSTPEIQALLQTAPRVSGQKAGDAVMAGRTEELGREINELRASLPGTASDTAEETKRAPRSVPEVSPQSSSPRAKRLPVQLVDTSPTEPSITLTYAQVPRYLHGSALFKNLDNCLSRFSIPVRYYAATDNVPSVADFPHLLRVMKYWGVDKILPGLCKFCMQNDIALWEEHLEIVAEELNLISTHLRIIFESAGNTTPFTRSIELERLEFVDIFARQGPRRSVEPLNAAARAGKVESIQLLRHHKYVWDASTCVAAAAHGQLETLKFLHEHGCPWDAFVTTEAAASGQVACFEYARDHGCQVNTIVACRRAYEGGHVNCMQLLWSAQTCTVAAMANDLPYLQFLHTNGCPWDEGTADAAGARGYLEILDFALRHGFSISAELAALVVYSGNMNCVRYIVEDQGLYLNEDGSVFGAAFQTGNLQCMQYLYDYYCPFVSFAFREARRDATLSHAEWDARLRECISFAVDKGWAVNPELEVYVHNEQLPLCIAYLQNL